MTLSIPTRKSEFLLGMRDSIPLIIGAIPFGIIFGTLATSNGLSIWETVAMSAIVFAGSAQFIAIGLFAAGTGWPIILLTTFVVNLRHLLYAASLVPHVKSLPQRWKSILAFGLTDESFAVVAGRYNRKDVSPYKHWYFLGSVALMYSNWQVCTWIGLTLGQQVPLLSDFGLEFAMFVTFIAMVTPYLKSSPMWVATLSAGISAVLTYSLPYKSGILISALVGILGGMLMEERNRRNKE